MKYEKIKNIDSSRFNPITLRFDDDDALSDDEVEFYPQPPLICLT